MGKKNKKEKGRGAEKNAQKIAKKDQKSEGMEDLEAMIAEFRALDDKNTKFNEEKCSHPSPRSNLSVTVHPDKEELILFGGEYFNGHKTFLYNDMFVYNLKKNEWSKHIIPHPPPPRCSHQAVAVSKEGGQLWIFGGEFASPNNTQFYHYKDLWVLHLKEHKWEEIKAAGGPSQRSGHRMIVYKKCIFMFGGFHESLKNFAYFNDCYMFSLTNYVWTKLNVTGTGPSPRSACQLSVTPNGILIVGGYSKVKVKKDVEKGTAHTDMFLLTEETDSKCKWTRVKDTGSKPWPRSGFSLMQMSPTRSVLFGGVCDEEDEEDLESFFYNSLSCLDLVSYRWFPMELRKSKTPKKKSSAVEEEGANEEVEDSVDESALSTAVILPCARMNAITAIKSNTLYVYGGIFEENEKQVTLNDLWSIDLKKMDTWKQMVEADDTSTDWFEDKDQDSTTDDEGETSGISKSRHLVEEHPPVDATETFASYWSKTSEYWLEKASNEADEDVRADVIRQNSEKLAKQYFEKETSET